MTTLRWAIYLLLVTVTCSSFASTARAQNVVAIERRLNQLLENTQRLTVEIETRYRGLPQYTCLSTESAQISDLAARVPGLLQVGDVPQATRNLTEVERLARHVQDELDRVDDHSADMRIPRNARVNTRQAYRTAKFVEDFAEDVRDDVRDVPRRGMVISVYSSTVPSIVNRSQPVYVRPVQPAYVSPVQPNYATPNQPAYGTTSPPTYYYPPSSSPQPNQVPAAGVPTPARPTPPAPSPGPVFEALPPPAGVPLQAPANQNVPAPAVPATGERST